MDFKVPFHPTTLEFYDSSFYLLVSRAQNLYKWVARTIFASRRKKNQNHKEESQDTAAKAGNDGILISASLQAKHAALGPQTIPCVKQTCQISSTTDVPVIAGAAIASRPGVSSTEQGG